MVADILILYMDEFRIARTFGIVSPKIRMINVMTIICSKITKTSGSSNIDAISRAMAADKTPREIFTKVFPVTIVMSNRRGKFSKSKTRCAKILPSSAKSSISRRFMLKKAVSLLLKSADKKMRKINKGILKEILSIESGTTQ